MVTYKLSKDAEADLVRIHQHNAVLIIGAGIAGAAAATACARRGMRVTVLERHERVAVEASGNPAGILYPYMARTWDAGTRFYLQGFAHTTHLLATLDARFELCGMAHYPKDGSAEEAARLRAIPEALGLSSNIATPTEYGFFMPHSGWVDVPSFVQALLNHPHIIVALHTEALHIAYADEKWQVRTGAECFTADALILANAYEAAALLRDHTLPMRRIRGQITCLPKTHLTNPPPHVLCYGGYLTPAIDGMHVVGATFDHGREDLQVDAEGHTDNLTVLQERFPELLPEVPDVTQLQGRAAFRTVSADRFPIVGALHDEAALRAAMTGVPYQPHTRIPHLPRCYVTLAHGARGLVSAPLAGEVIASALAGETPPVPQEVQALLAPERFVVRAWRKGKRFFPSS
jgi:tRNA 5-methylaminomethyl-2-thiouridine biosynthesis bifunctional protein